MYFDGLLNESIELDEASKEWRQGAAEERYLSKIAPKVKREPTYPHCKHCDKSWDDTKLPKGKKSNCPTCGKHSMVYTFKPKF